MANKDNESYCYKKKTAFAASLVMGALVVSQLIFIVPLPIFNYEIYKAHASYSTEEFQQLSKKLNDMNKSLIPMHQQYANMLSNFIV